MKSELSIRIFGIALFALAAVYLGAYVWVVG